MATMMSVLRARCPLCGSPVLGVGRTGHAFDEELHPVQAGPGRGYTLCDACSILADLPTSLTFN